MNNAESSQQSPVEDSSLSIARGGPTFLPDLVSPLTRASVFESDVFHELESLKALLNSEPTEFEEEDISVDELKIYSDEELVSEAMKIAFENDQAGTSSDFVENPCSSGATDDHGMSDHNTSASIGSSDGFCSEISYDGVENGVNLKNMKGRAKAKANIKKRKKDSQVGEKHKEADETYLSKLGHLAKIRQKQEEDKASVKLHSFSHRKDNSSVLSSGTAETLKYVESASCLAKGKSSLTGRHVRIQYPEVILCVEVHHHKQTWKKEQELLVLGSQALTELKDKIRCVTDLVMQKAGRHDPSGYFLIEDVFCNDTRDQSAIDYSKPILDWLKNSREEALAKWDCIVSGVGKAGKDLLTDIPLSKLPNFRSVDMQRTRFCDLGFRLGTGYQYCHQGDCKHMIIIRDMRLIHPDDVQNRAAYPLLVYQLKAVLKKCSVCNIYKATKVTLDDKMAGENPCYFCEKCYFHLHYSEEGYLLYDQFSVYDYLQDYY